MVELLAKIDLSEIQELACGAGYERARAVALSQGTPETLTLEVSGLAQIWAETERGEGSDALRSDLGWLRNAGLIPAISARRADLSGADLSGARYSEHTTLAADLDVQARGLVRECDDCYSTTPDHALLCAECQGADEAE